MKDLVRARANYKNIVEVALEALQKINYENFVEVALEALQNVSCKGFVRAQPDYERFG